MEWNILYTLPTSETIVCTKDSYMLKLYSNHIAMTHITGFTFTSEYTGKSFQNSYRPTLSSNDSPCNAIVWKGRMLNSNPIRTLLPTYRHNSSFKYTDTAIYRQR